jgi:thermostable 8-oxoguanine DNA glycosylase
VSELDDLKRKYNERKEELAGRSSEWKEKGASRNSRQLFKYLCTNVLSAGANWDTATRVADQLDEDGRLWKSDATDLAIGLEELGYAINSRDKKEVRRDRLRKATWLHKARERFFGPDKQEGMLDWVGRLRVGCDNNPVETRNMMADKGQPGYHLDGIGPKVASHFLRGLGFAHDNLAILDYWVLGGLVKFGVITEKEGRLKGLDDYLDVERKMKEWAGQNLSDIPFDVLDLLLWRRN